MQHHRDSTSFPFCLGRVRTDAASFVHGKRCFCRSESLCALAEPSVGRMTVALGSSPDQEEGLLTPADVKGTTSHVRDFRAGALLSHRVN